MKIHIIGGPGSGKSRLAKELSKQCGIPHYDLDDLFWENDAGRYGTKRDPRERDVLLGQILREKDRIIEGVYYAWCTQCFEDADRICLLSIPAGLCKRRIVRRFIRRKRGQEKGKKETLRDLAALLKWTDRYQKKNLPQIRDLLALYADKTTEISDPTDDERETLCPKE